MNVISVYRLLKRQNGLLAKYDCHFMFLSLGVIYLLVKFWSRFKIKWYYEAVADIGDCTHVHVLDKDYGGIVELKEVCAEYIPNTVEYFQGFEYQQITYIYRKSGEFVKRDFPEHLSLEQIRENYKNGLLDSQY